VRIYIAGPYTADSEAEIHDNVLAAIDAAILLVKKGHAPYVPHLTHYIDKRSTEIGAHLTWRTYLDWDLEWLEACDALLFLGSSRGADIELEEAKRAGKLIFRSVDEVAPAAEADARQVRSPEKPGTSRGLSSSKDKRA
jgi:hypothetical protein